MNQNLTNIVVVMDRSGSMQSCQAEAETSINHFIDEQKKQPGECHLTLVQFDNEYEVVYDNMDINSVSEIKLVPRGMTALNDAIGTAINTAGNKLSKINESERPGLVVVVIITDGGENASHEFTTSQIKKMIEHQRDTYNWQFTFLGANQDAFAEGGKLGLDRSCIANYGVNKTDVAIKHMSSKVSGARMASSLGNSASLCYTDEEREEMV